MTESGYHSNPKDEDPMHLDEQYARVVAAKKRSKLAEGKPKSQLGGFQGIILRIRDAYKNLTVNEKDDERTRKRKEKMKDQLPRLERIVRIAKGESDEESGVDGLTGIMNRKAFDIIYPTVYDAAKRNFYGMEGEPENTLAVFFIDIDNFASFNSEHGHNFADEILIAVAKCLNDKVRGGDTVARFGGEEFIFIASNMHGRESALRLAEELREAVKTVAIEGVNVTCSIGVSLLDKSICGLDGNLGEKNGQDELIRRADKAMYTAKKRGKNKSVSYSAEVEEEAKGYERDNPRETDEGSILSPESDTDTPSQEQIRDAVSEYEDLLSSLKLSDEQRRKAHDIRIAVDSLLRGGKESDSTSKSA